MSNGRRAINIKNCKEDDLIETKQIKKPEQSRPAPISTEVIGGLFAEIAQCHQVIRFHEEARKQAQERLKILLRRVEQMETGA